MKRTGIVGIVLLFSLSIAGCCTPGFYGNSPYGPPRGCGSLFYRGVVDYVDGSPGTCETNNGNNYGNCYSNGYGYGYNGCLLNRPNLANSVNCLGNLVNGIFVLGEGAFCLAASPFVLVGNLICGGCAGYETFPNYGCSNEVYYGDNCYQPQDFCDPCANLSTGCSCGSGVATSNCTQCANGYTEGIRYEGDVPKQSTNYRPLTQPVRNPAYYAQTNRNRPIAQTAYSQRPTQQPVQQQWTSQTPPRPVAYDDENQTINSQE